MEIDNGEELLLDCSFACIHHISANSNDGGYHGKAYSTRRPSLLSKSFLNAAGLSRQRLALKLVFRWCVGDVELQEKLGRNDPCPCGSGKRYKRCCLKSGKFDGSHRDYYFQRAPVIRRSGFSYGIGMVGGVRLSTKRDVKEKYQLGASKADQ